MRVMMLATACGPDGTFEPGQIIDLPLDKAHDYIASGAAEPVHPDQVDEQLLERYHQQAGADAAAVKRPMSEEVMPPRLFNAPRAR
jgi:hypothetical protein